MPAARGHAGGKHAARRKPACHNMIKFESVRRLPPQCRNFAGRRKNGKITHGFRCGRSEPGSIRAPSRKRATLRISIYSSFGGELLLLACRAAYGSMARFYVRVNGVTLRSMLLCAVCTYVVALKTVPISSPLSNLNLSVKHASNAGRRLTPW